MGPDCCARLGVRVHDLTTHMPSPARHTAEHGSSSQETASTSAPDISQELNKSIRQTAR